METDIRPSSVNGLDECELTVLANGDVTDIADDIVFDLGTACTGLGLTTFGSNNGV